MGERSVHVDVERKIESKKYTHRIKTHIRSRDEKDVEIRKAKNSQAI